MTYTNKTIISAITATIGIILMSSLSCKAQSRSGNSIPPLNAPPANFNTSYAPIRLACYNRTYIYVDNGIQYTVKYCGQKVISVTQKLAK